MAKISAPCESVTTSLIYVMKVIYKNRKIGLLQYARFEIKVNKRQYKVGNFLFNFSKVVLLVELLLKMTLPCNV